MYVRFYLYLSNFSKQPRLNILIYFYNAVRTNFVVLKLKMLKLELKLFGFKERSFAAFVKRQIKITAEVRMAPDRPADPQQTLAFPCFVLIPFSCQSGHLSN